MGETKYGKLLEALKAGIRSGKYGPGSPFPSLRALIRRFGLSDRTVQHALDELESEGLIAREQGRGTFVTLHGAARKIGLIMPGAAYSEFFSILVCEVLKLAQAEDKILLFGDISSKSPEVRVRQAKKLAADFIAQGAAGVLYQPVEFVHDSEAVNRAIVSQFVRSGIPVGLIDCDIVKPPRRSEFDLVSINNESAGGRLAELLIANGAKRIHFLIHPDHSPNMYKRMNGVMNVVLAHGLEWTGNHVLDLDPCDRAEVLRHVRRYRPDAVVCGTDMLAAYLGQTLASSGLKIPDDIMLAGFDDVKASVVMSPQLTTVHQPCEQIAERAFYRLLDRIANPALPPVEIQVEAPIIERSSTMRAGRSFSKRTQRTKESK